MLEKLAHAEAAGKPEDIPVALEDLAISAHHEAETTDPRAISSECDASVFCNCDDARHCGQALQTEIPTPITNQPNT